jgi:four helix bundle protein
MTYKKLIVWQKSDEFAFEVYKLTKNFPKDELYGLISQLRRAALSIPTNIVEGYARKGDKELARFINIAIGSLAEVEYLLSFSQRLGYVTHEDYNRIEMLRSETGKLLWNFYKKVACSPASLFAC